MPRSGGGSSKKPLMRCTFNETGALSAYTWSDPRDIKPVGQWTDIDYDLFWGFNPATLYGFDGHFTGRFQTANGHAVGDALEEDIPPDQEASNDTINAAARCDIELGTPARRILYVAQTEGGTEPKQDHQILFRVPTLPAANGYGQTVVGEDPATDPDESPIYHSVQILRDEPNGSNQSAFLLHLWRDAYAADRLLAQAVINTEVPWAAATEYTAWVKQYQLPGVVAVIPTTPTGFMYLCVQTGTSHATDEPGTGAQDPWPTVVGERVTNGTAIFECRPIVDYQTSGVQLEIIDTGSAIQVTLNDQIRISAEDTLYNDKTGFGIHGLHSSGDVKFRMIEVWG